LIALWQPPTNLVWWLDSRPHAGLHALTCMHKLASPRTTGGADVDVNHAGCGMHRQSRLSCMVENGGANVHDVHMSIHWQHLMCMHLHSCTAPTLFMHAIIEALLLPQQRTCRKVSTTAGVDLVSPRAR
jgi:hypothetical protein